MFTQIVKKTAVNLITGSLGAGKTTLLKNFIKNKPTQETWAVLVNEFGAIGIDGSILETQNTSTSNSIHIKQIPGGCICCTAQNELTAAIEQIIEKINPDRLLIEPTGLGEPDTLVDILQGDFFKKRFDVQSVFAVIDSSYLTVDEIGQYTILQNLFNMADVVVLNKTDLADPSNLKDLYQYAHSVYPLKQAVIMTQQSVVDNALLSVSSKTTQPAKSIINTQQNTLDSKAISNTDSDNIQTSRSIKSNDLFADALDLPGLVKRESQHQISTLSIGWVFEPSIIFNWKSLQSLFSTFDNQPCIKRAKGVFRVGKPWMLFQWVNKQTSRELIAYRRDSRFEILITENNTFDLHQFELDLKKCIQNA